MHPYFDFSFYALADQKQASIHPDILQASQHDLTPKETGCLSQYLQILLGLSQRCTVNCVNGGTKVKYKKSWDGKNQSFKATLS